MPSHQGASRDQTRKSIHCFTPQPLAFGGQTPELTIIEVHFLAQQFLKNADFFL
jgi:hypothetical protein